ncbi:MAG: DUF1573 domain-containing protein [Crocinitomicaceae bacterium]|nr:DUF1573 domain-containing protein [Crocinitomicaceae bacterium]
MRLFFAIIIALNSAFILTDDAEFYFKDKSHRFADTKEGVLLEHDFVFTNKGTDPLVISGYDVSCSCTKIDFPKEPILPEEEGVIHMSFDTNGKYGFQSRKIQILSNAKKKTILTFKVVVINE